MTHSIVAPSSAARRIQCPASTTFERAFPEVEENREPALEGEAAHWAVAEQLSGRLIDVGLVAPNGKTIDVDMLRAADLMYDDVLRELSPHQMTLAHVRVEQKIAIRRVHPESFGTPDAFAVKPGYPGTPAHVWVWDFKYGHRIVDAFENAQMIEYLAGICEGMHDLDPGANITCTVVQPRAFHREGPVRKWRTRLQDLRGLINISANAAAEALGPSPRAKVGPECRDCRARHACPTLQRASLSEMDAAERTLPLELDAASVGLELRLARRAIELLSARAAGLEEQASQMIKQGKPVPGWRLEHGFGREDWTRPPAEIIAIGQAFGIDLVKPIDVITPTQARKAGLDPAITAHLTGRQRAAATLVPEDETLGRRTFG